VWQCRSGAELGKWLATPSELVQARAQGVGAVRERRPQQHVRRWNRAPATPGGTREWARAGLEWFAGGAGAERERR
jgi:hypothetical protein